MDQREYAEQLEREQQEERYDNWCALGNHDPNAVGTWERFEAEEIDRAERWAEDAAEERANGGSGYY